MANLAAVLPAAKTPLEIREVDIYKPSPNELLIKNEIIAFSPADFKIVKKGLFPLQYPVILGTAFGGTVEVVGSNVTDFKVGDKVVAVLSKLGGNQYGAWQRYLVVAREEASKVPQGIDLLTPATLITNFSTVVGLFTGRAGLDKASLDGSVSAKSKKVLIYGGSSSFGSLAVQYVTQAGYIVVTTTSPRNQEFVSKLGAAKVIDHTQKDLTKALIAEGPYDLVVDSVSFPETVAVNAAVLIAQGGGTLYGLQSGIDPETLPEDVTYEFRNWPSVLNEDKHVGLLEWALTTYFPQGVASGKLIPLPIEKIKGGLKGVSDALDRLEKGVSGVKLVADPWE